MNMLETISIDVYPWAAPTDEQRAWFDALSVEEKRAAIVAAIEEGFSSPPSENPSRTSSGKLAPTGPMRHRITQRAERDLLDIYRYTVETFGPNQADKYLRELEAVFELIAEYPRVGRTYEGETRQFVHGKHIILYRIGQTEVVVGRIFHGAQARPKA